LDKYLQIVGYKDLSTLLSKTPKEIENDLIEFIISLKERGCKRSTIANYVKPVIGVRNVNDIILNTSKINRFIPPNVRNKKTRPYSASEIQKLLDIADERMRCVILLASSSGLRNGAIPDLSIGSCEPVQDLYKISVYEGEPEAYVPYCTSECRKAIDVYLEMRSRYGEDTLNKNTPLIREQFDRRDPFAVAHPKRITRLALKRKLTEMAEAAALEFVLL
jgi:integrase